MKFKLIMNALAALILLPSAVGFAGSIKPLATAVPGAVPEGINYQGRLEQNGFPVTGTKSMTFRVYDAITGGNLIYNAGAQEVTFEKGLFSAVISISTTALASGGARYLEIEIDTTVLEPREALNSAPYALVAKTVEGTLDISGGGLSVSSTATGAAALFVSSQTGNVGVGTSAPAYRLDVQGDIRSTGTLLAVGFAGDRAVLSGGSFSVGGSALSVAGGLVGIGTSAPDQRLSVAGNISQTGVFISSGAGNSYFAGNIGVGTTAPLSKLHVLDGDIRIATSALSSGGIYFPGGTFLGSASLGTVGSLSNPNNALVQTDSDGNAAGDVVFQAGTGGGNEKMRVTNAGLVGIGTSAPGAALDVNGTAQFGAGASKSSMTAAGLQLVSGSTVTSNGTLSFSTAASAALTGTPALFIDRSGYVGAGTASPAVSLHAAGDIRAEGVYRVAGGIAAMQAVSASLIEIGSQASVDMQFVSNSSTPRLYIANTGNVGVGMSTPSALFTVGTSSVVFTSAGKVGVGTMSPSSKLHLSSGVLTIDGESSGLTVLAVSTFVVTGGKVGVATTNPGTLFQVAAGTLSVTSAGLVGIGTTAPQTMLDVRGEVQIGSGTAKSTFTNAGNLLVPGDVQAGTFNGGVLLTNPMAVTMTLNGSPSLTTSQPGISLSTHLFITAGSFGIGTSSPASKLHLSSGTVTVDGTGPGLSIGGSTFVVTAGFAGIGTSAPAAKLHLSSGTLLVDGSGAGLSVGGANFFVAGSSVGIGTLSPASKLHMSSGTLVLDGANAAISVGVSTFVVSGGRVGVGTSAPGAALDVGGSAQFGTGASKSTFTASGNLQLVSGSTVTSNGTLSFSTAASAALTGTPALFIDGQGRIGAGTAAPAALLHLSGTDSTPAQVRIANTTSGTGKTWSLASGNDGSLRIENTGTVTAMTLAPATGNVGIGTTAPTSKLHVVGDIAVSSGILFADGTYQQTAAGNSQWVNNGSDIYNSNLGNVGIGTTNPASMLEVYKSNASSFTANAWGGSLTPPQALTITNSSPGGSDPVLLYRMATTAGSLKSAGSIGLAGRAAWTDGAVGSQIADMYFVLRDGSDALQERMRIDYSGNVGIGTSAPDSLLHVSKAVSNGEARVHLQNSGGGAGATMSLKIGQGSPEDWGELTHYGADSSFRIRNRTGGGATRGTLALNWDGGSVGIGTTAPQSTLDVKGSAAIGSYGGASAAPANGLIISGNVGIGTSNPGQALSVAGTIESTSGGFKYPNGGVQTTANRAPNAAFLRLAGNASTTSTTYTAVLSTFNVTLVTTGGNVLVSLTGSVNGTSGEYAEFQITMDGGSAQTLGRIFSPNGAWNLPINLSHLYTGVSAGSHTFSVEWRVQATGTLTCSAETNPNVDTMRLLAQEF